MDTDPKDMYRVNSNDAHHQDILRQASTPLTFRGPEAIFSPPDRNDFELLCRE